MPQTDEKKPPVEQKKRRSRWRHVGIVFLFLVILFTAARLAMPYAVRWYVNQTINQTQLYEGRIGMVHIHLWRGAYSIDDVRISKVTGNVPVPLFAAKRVDFAMQWDALLHHKLVGRVLMQDCELNFVDAGDPSQSQTGTGGPWLQIIRDLFPFKINAALVRNGSIHFRAYHRDPPVDVYLSQLDASIENLTNIRDETAPLVTTVNATALAMDQARLEYQMKLDPFSYHPSFDLAVRLLGLDVQKINSLARSYGGIDFEHGFFDLVVELKSREGLVEGYVKPLFRHIRIIDLKKDLLKDDPLEFFWETVVGVTADLLKNRPRDQLATVIPMSGDVSGPNTDILATIGNILRNAFIRAYLPKFQGGSGEVNKLNFGRGSIIEPTAGGDSEQR